MPTGLKLRKADKSPWGKQFSDVSKSSDFKDAKKELPIPIGFDDDEKLHIEGLPDLGNLIIAGYTLSQKENFVHNVLLTCLLRYAPSQLRLMLTDPTHYLDLYDGIPHLLSPVITEYGKLISAFRRSLSEMERRLKQFAQAGVRNIFDYNELSSGEALPRILVITFRSGSNALKEMSGIVSIYP